MKRFYSHGKLLLTGEYLVLDGATALALPTKFGQSLEVKPSSVPGITWTSFDEKGTIWFRAHFKLQGDVFVASEGNSTDEDRGFSRETENRLLEILSAAYSLNPEGFERQHGLEIVTHMDFNRSWGLGSSSTLINNIGQWLKVDSYQLLEKTFGGSGYDIASAQHGTPITYTLSPEGRSVFAASFDPDFKNELFFVYLNQKQNSRDSISQYKSRSKNELQEARDKITSITQQIITCTHLPEFELLLNIHETVVSQVLGIPKIKSRLFPDYPGAIKSLGGWGGDFILATGGEEQREYFQKKGYTTIFGYSEMIR